jgi:hypothetical protein
VPALPQRSRPRRQWPGTTNLGTLLRDPALAINELASEELAKRGFDDFRPAHGTIGQHITDQGSRVTELAQLAPGEQTHRRLPRRRPRTPGLRRATPRPLTMAARSSFASPSAALARKQRRARSSLRSSTIGAWCSADATSPCCANSCGACTRRSGQPRRPIPPSRGCRLGRALLPSRDERASREVSNSCPPRTRERRQSRHARRAQSP